MKQLEPVNDEVTTAEGGCSSQPTPRESLDCTSSGPPSLFPSPPGRVLGEGYVLKTFCHLTGPITLVIKICSQN